MTTRAIRLRRTVIATGAVTEYEWDYRNRLIEVTDRASADGCGHQCGHVPIRYLRSPHRQTS